MRIGAIGAGRWGRNVVATLDGLGVLAAVAEPDEALRAAVHARHPGAELFAHHLDLLERPLDAVAIATPAATHFRIARDALLAGKDVFVEKPMTVSAAEAAELTRLAAGLGRVLMVGHLLLYQPAVQFLRQFLEGGEAGELYALHQVRRNLGTIRQQENALFSLGVHDLAVFAHLVGEAPCGVQAVGQCVTAPGREDEVAVHLRYPGGVQAHLTVSWLWPYKERRLVALATRGALVYDELAQTVTLHRAYGLPDGSVRDEGQELLMQGAGEPLRLELQHFTECVRTRGTPRSDGAQGLAVVGLMEQISAQLGGRVKV
ncbi:hypothetical protein DEIPH_ctg026orf0056 [Deinococcus phoenicis]|uniref:Uncharacterized protein n=1 Tax=Deinococcus phoenicis TaxID=1476583 RepID=A0A016QQK4_9DEIO|nr:Gfo/Idh/MocA family oxidoreductase [Deinococcus phoenicis]EYB68152.1 hypothetical protein DEIPH_ctg026orf0056 [Deinococcus phoenicis]